MTIVACLLVVLGVLGAVPVLRPAVLVVRVEDTTVVEAFWLHVVAILQIRSLVVVGGAISSDPSGQALRTA